MNKLPFSYKYYIILIPLCVMLMPAHLVLGQEHKNLNFQHITKANGLSSSDITAIVEDKKGFIWIGTYDGLNKFDGHKATTYRNEPNDSTSIADNHITCLFTDSQGTLWIGTKNNGLSRYIEANDTFYNYSFDLYDSTSLNFNYVTSIVEDSQRNMWVGTLMGLNLYHKESDNFQRFLYFRELKVNDNTLEMMDSLQFPVDAIKSASHLIDTSFIKEQWFKDYLAPNIPLGYQKKLQEVIYHSQFGNHGEPISSIQPDQKGNLWIGFKNSGIGYFNLKKGITSKFTQENSALNTNKIATIYLSKNHLWVSGENGSIFQINLNDNQITEIPIAWSKSYIKSILRDHIGRLWIGNGEGLGLFNEKSGKFIRHIINFKTKSGLLPEEVSCIYEDKRRNLWLGSFQGGVNLHPNKHAFNHFNHSPNLSSSLSKNSVSSIYVDSQEDLWVGYYTSGVDLFHKNQKQYFEHKHESNRVGCGTLFAITEDRDHHIWFGSNKGGLQKFNKSDQRFTTFLHDPMDSNSISGNDVRAISEDLDGNLWLAIHGGGVNQFNRQNQLVKRYNTVYPDIANSLASDWVHTVLADSKNRIWAATVSGLSVLKPGKDDFITYDRSNSNLSHNNVVALFEDRDHNIWAGTEYGLNLFIDSLNSFGVFTKKHGLPSNSIKSITQDDHGNIWISTNDGLSKFNFQHQLFMNYTEEDGLQSDEFFVRAFAKSNHGTLYFGGGNGLNKFHPDSLKSNLQESPTYLDHLKLFNKKITLKDNTGILNNQLMVTKDLWLKHDQNFFSLSFKTLNYVNMNRNHYQYILTGFNDNWIDIGEQQEAVFTNVPPGEYEFKVKSTNDEGQWSNEYASIKIHIEPPLWKSYWAYFIYILLFSGLMILIRNAILKRIRFKHKMELDEMKINFFTNISHEFRTPLTLILGPLNELITNKKHTKQEGELYNLMHRNGKQLLKLVNQLMDIYQLDAGFTKLKITNEKLNVVIKNIFESFTYKADQKKIHYYLLNKINPEEQGYIDVDKIEKVLNNLISNALKFTPAHGAIMVTVDIQETQVNKTVNQPFRWLKEVDQRVLQISVEDSGCGISSNDQSKIFNRFYQSENYEADNPGTGIGLSLVSQLIKIHRGSISVSSEIMEGCCFTFSIPIDQNAYLTSELAKHPIIEHIESDQTYANETLVLDKEKSQKTTHKAYLLIIDDNEDIRKYLKYNLSNEFRIEEAKHGKHGLDIAIQTIPDLILCDIMMPDMNGLQFCQAIKNDQRTCHIPVTLLTAKSGEEYHFEGLAMGADDYIIKPFNMEILRNKLLNKVKQQHLFKKKIEKEAPLPKKILIHKKDEEFLLKIYEILADNLSNTELGPDQLAKEVGMSRSVLYRKIDGLTGHSVSIMIRNYRLKEASKILNAELIPIKTLAFKVGFKDPSYFTTCFKKMYGVSPKEYNNKMAIQINEALH